MIPQDSNPHQFGFFLISLRYQVQGATIKQSPGHIAFINDLPWISNVTVLLSVPAEFMATQVKTPVSKGWNAFLMTSSVPDPLHKTLYFPCWRWREHVLFRSRSPLQLPISRPFLNHLNARGGLPSVSQNSLTFWEAFTDARVVKLIIFGGFSSDKFSKRSHSWNHGRMIRQNA